MRSVGGRPGGLALRLISDATAFHDFGLGGAVKAADLFDGGVEKYAQLLVMILHARFLVYGNRNQAPRRDANAQPARSAKYGVIGARNRE